MTNLTILKVLATSLVVAGSSAVALSLNDPHVAVDQTTAANPVHHASAQTVVASDASTGRDAAAIGPAKSALFMPVADKAADASDNATEAEGAVAPEAVSPAPSEIRLGITSDSDEAVRCLAGLGLDPGAVVEFVIQLDEGDEGSRFVADMEFLDAKHKTLAGLRECIEAELPPEFAETVPPGMLRMFATFRAGKQRAKPAQSGLADLDAAEPQEVAKRGHARPRGTLGAPVTIIECIDYDCPFCKKSRGTMDQIMADYGDAVAVYELQHPLEFHPGALPAARATIAAGRQGKLWEMRDLMFDNLTQRSDEALSAFAAELGLDVTQFERDFHGEEVLAIVEEQAAACESNGARGTPSFFVNGELVTGAQPYEKFEAMIAKELAAKSGK